VRTALPTALGVAALLGCDAMSDPSAVAALDFTGIPFPAVVTGDSIRDTLGAAAPLRATAYDGNGNEIPGAPIVYFSLDTGVVVHPDGHLVATRRDGTLRLLASFAGLQSQIRTIQVTRLPDSVAATSPDTVALQYALPDAASNVSPGIALRLTSSDTTGGVSANVAGWVVRWRLIHAGDTLALTDTSSFALWDAGGTRHSLRDTTGTDGTSARRLRVYANQLPPQPDSVIVVAEVRALGAQVPGSPLRFVVNITPPGP
jgi:hypothetical protein